MDKLREENKAKTGDKKEEDKGGICACYIF